MIEHGADLNHIAGDGQNVVSKLLRSGNKNIRQVMINLLRVPRNQGGVNWKILKTQELDKIRPLIVEV